MYSSSPNTELQRAALIYPRTFVLQLLFLYLLCMNKHHVSVVIVTKAIPGKESMPSHIRQSQDQKQTGKSCCCTGWRDSLDVARAGSGGGRSTTVMLDVCACLTQVLSPASRLQERKHESLTKKHF